MKKLVVFCLLGFVSVSTYAADLSGVSHVNITSDTGANAKNMAMAEARRQVINDVVSRYAAAPDVRTLVADTRDAELSNLVSSTSITGEKLSATSYAADIKMTLDAAAVGRWLGDNNIKNSIDAPTQEQDTFTANIELVGGLGEWIEFQSAMRDANIIPQIQRISGATVTVVVPQSVRAKFLNAVRARNILIDN